MPTVQVKETTSLFFVAELRAMRYPRIIKKWVKAKCPSMTITKARQWAQKHNHTIVD